MAVSKHDYYTLGTTFLRGYYQIYDADNNRLGLTPHIYSMVSSIR